MQGQQQVVAVLPLSNVSGSGDVAAQVETAIRERLGQRGWRVAATADVEQFLEEQRIRYLDSLSAAALQTLREKVGANAVVVGSILGVSDSNNPGLALAARMLDSEGRVVWGEVAGISASQTEGAFGSGRRTTPEALVKAATGRLLKRVPAPGEVRKPDLEAGFLARGAATYRSGSHPRGKVLRVCIMPFTAKSPEAARVMVEILTVRLEATGEFDVVEPADFREAMRAEKLQSIAAMTSTELTALSRHLDTTVFLRGNVHVWRESLAGRSEVQFDMTLVDVARGEILWAVTHQRKGLEYTGAFQRGAIDNVVSLADHAVSEAIAQQHRARPKHVPGRNEPAHAAQKER